MYYLVRVLLPDNQVSLIPKKCSGPEEMLSL